MKKQFLIFFPILLCGLPACRKDEPQPNNHGLLDYTVLPPATQEGKNTFGCLVNGEVWVPRVEILVPWYDKAALLSEKDFKGSGIVDARLLNKNMDDYFTIAFSPGYFIPITYRTDTSLFHFNPDFSRGLLNFHHEEGDTTNYLKITAIDTVRNFISGEFQCTLFTSDKNHKLEITQGRFDMPYYAE